MSSPEAILNIGIVGAGRGGWALLKVLRPLPRIRVVGICDLDPTAPGLEPARAYRIPVYHHVSELLEAHQMDWLINVSASSVTAGHLFERELANRHVKVMDGTSAEVVWRFLVSFHQLLEGCPQQERAFCQEMGWSFVSTIADAVTDMQARLTDLAFHDPLTGLFTRRILLEFLEREIRSTFRLSQPLSLLLVDVDHFKSVNDTFGHAAGDMLLKDLAILMRETHRSGDLVARMGGEEFVTVLPNTGLEEAEPIAQRLRQVVEQQMRRPDGKPLTVSIGLAALNVEQPIAQRMSCHTLLECADQALYQAKNAGRNRVMVHRREWERVAS